MPKEPDLTPEEEAELADKVEEMAEDAGELASRLKKESGLE